MTLFETLVALVILGLTAVGFLQAFQVTSRSVRGAEAWVQAVGYAEASMEETKLSTAADLTLSEPLPPGFAREIDVQPWLGSPGLEQVTVRVALPGGGSFELHRLVRTR